MKRILLITFLLIAVFASFFVAQDSIGRVLSLNHNEMAMEGACEGSECKSMQTTSCSEHCFTIVSQINETQGALPLLLVFVAGALAAVLAFKLPKSERYFRAFQFFVTNKRRLALITIRRE